MSKESEKKEEGKLRVLAPWFSTSLFCGGAGGITRGALQVFQVGQRRADPLI
jgi:hypothetical protein